MVRSLLLEYDAEKRRAYDLYSEGPLLRVKLDRHRKLYFGSYANRLHSASDLAGWAHQEP